MRLTLLSAMVVFLFPFWSYGGEVEDWVKIFQNVENLVRERNIEALESLSQEYRSGWMMTRSGIQKLSLFYDGVYKSYSRTWEFDRYWSGDVRLAKNWQRQYPNSPSAYISEALIYYKRAFLIRKNSWESELNEYELRHYDRYLSMARTLLEKHSKVCQSDPEWYVLMLKIAKLEKWDERRYLELFEESVESFPDYVPLYATASEYYFPRFGGSSLAFDRFANAPSEHVPEDTESMLYARVYFHAYEKEYGIGIFRQSSVDWGHLKEGYDRILEKYPTQWNINVFARLACLKKDKEKAKALFSLIEGGGNYLVWFNPPTFKKCKKWAL